MLILKILAFILFVIGSFWNPPRINLIGLGLAAWVLSELIQEG